MIRILNANCSRWALGTGLAVALSLSAAYPHGSGEHGKPNNPPDTVLYAFTGGPSDGSYPVAGLLTDGSGNFYGTTEYGGTNDLGTVFALAPSGTESVLYAFAGGSSDGAYPASSLIEDSSGNLYGTTIEGGTGQCSEDGCGTVFEIPAGGTESVIYSFEGNTDGASPQAGLIADQTGNFYGTTYAGGASPTGAVNCEGGCGTVFEVSPANGAWTETILYSFTNGTDGAGPLGGVVMDGAGNLYGTTSYGSDSLNCQGGCGTVFELSPTGNGSWTEKTIYSVKGNGSGANPSSSLYLDSKGDLYGTTPDGGSVKCGGGCGVLFELTPAKNGTWNEIKVRSFAGGKNGAFPIGNLTEDQQGNLYGTTVGAGLYNCGIVYQKKTTGTVTPLHSFTGNPDDGCAPYGGIIAGTSGQLYGLTSTGGTTNNGVIFELSE